MTNSFSLTAFAILISKICNVTYFSYLRYHTLYCSQKLNRSTIVDQGIRFRTKIRAVQEKHPKSDVEYIPVHGTLDKDCYLSRLYPTLAVQRTVDGYNLVKLLLKQCWLIQNSHLDHHNCSPPLS